jgi:aminoglycoside phosphotransferase family enzyme/predicted kinase
MRTPAADHPGVSVATPGATHDLPALLASDVAYPPSATGVEVRETHISWVFLAGDRAYKLKKPLVLPFLDYGTPKRRLQMCREEFRLNRRLAPDLYLGVCGVAVNDDGVEFTSAEDPRAVDYVVEMRRYAERDTLAAMLDRGELRRSDIDRVARTMERFHAACEPADGLESGSHRIEREVERNAEELLELAEHPGERKRIRAMVRFMLAFAGSHAGEFDDRAARGLIRECHGDVRAEHVLLKPTVSVVDCVEFDPDMRTLDVADDLAFLVMDLAALGGERFASRLIDAYRAAGGDCGRDAVVAFFAAHRALVRAKVLCVRAAQQPPTGAAHGHASAQARDLLGLAEHFSWQARLPLAIIVCGVPASGKSHLARALADLSRLPYVSSDVTRKRLAGIGQHQRGPAEIYGAEWNTRTYDELGNVAAREVDSRGGVIVDATFRRLADRQAFMAVFATAVPTLFIECQAPVAVLAARATRRQRDPSRVSDADLEVVTRERSTWEPLDEIPAGAHIALRTDRPLDEIIEDVRALLDQRL